MASASYINGIVYIVGGYEVYPNGNELSVDLVHRFDCETNQFLSNATSLPTAIDDHVYGVWRESLLTFVTGWSNTGNVAQVQLHNPTINQWESQNQIWNFSRYSSFGASGVIVADTIFYLGGAASSFGFPLQPVIRQGEIDPLDPLNITWTDMYIDTSLSLYRGAALSIDGIPTWIGGSNNTYNYNGLAYDGSGGVNSSEKIIQYLSGALSSNGCSTVKMDLRGTAWFPEHGELSISGGMGQNQEVSSQLVRLNIAKLSADYLEYNDHLPKIFPNPNNGQCIIESARKFDLIVYDINGSEIESIASIKCKKLNLGNGIYILQISTDEKCIIES